MTTKTNDMTDTQKKAAKWLTYFKTKKRDNGDKFYVLSDKRPQELYDLVYKTHDGMLPDDYKYEFICDALYRIMEYEDLDTAADEIDADCYTSDLLKWVGSNLTRAVYVEEAVKEFGCESKDFDLFKVIAWGQVQEKREVFSMVRNAVEE